MTSFNPNSLTFEDGIKRIYDAVGGRSFGDEIVTSQDGSVASATQKLRVSNVPDGFSKWQLPVFLDGPSQFFMSFAGPGTKVPEHSHDEGDGIRLILSGSIKFNGKELKAGDWMYIPTGSRYSFEVGDMGVGQFYCYRCCCA